MRISDWSSDVCSSDLPSSSIVATSSGTRASITMPETRSGRDRAAGSLGRGSGSALKRVVDACMAAPRSLQRKDHGAEICRSEEHTSELQSLIRISYAVFCLTKHTTRKKVKIIITQI